MTAVRLAVRVHPGARRAGVLGRLASGEWKLAVSAPAEGGRANEAVTELLADVLGLKRRQVVVARGRSSRAKQIDVEGVTPGEMEQRLQAACSTVKGEHGQ